jgi:hypothetical protein
VDWNRVRREYVFGSKSLRALADEYHCSQSTLRKRAANEKWTEQRNDYRAKVEQKYMDMCVEREVKRVERLHCLADNLMDKLDKAIEELDEMCSVEQQDGEYKVARVSGVAVDRAGAKQIASSLKDVKDLLNVRDYLDRQEQQARIEHLKSQSDSVAAGVSEVQVVLSDEVKKYAE